MPSRTSSSSTVAWPRPTTTGTLALGRYAERRKPNADAIAELALDNFVEMRDKVASPWFRLGKRVEHAVERHAPDRFQSLYELVSFTTVPYAEARAARRGAAAVPVEPRRPRRRRRRGGGGHRSAVGVVTTEPGSEGGYAGAADAHLDLRHHLTYAEYLGLDAVLSAQHPRTDAHDEMLFIVQHQATELWLKLLLHELHTVAGLVDADNLEPAFKSLARVERVMQGLISSWDVLTTMTPADYGSFRAALDTSSGFQSFQFRELEFVLGNRDAVYLEPFRHQPDRFAHLDAVLHEPSLYDRVVRLLVRRGLAADADLVERDWSVSYQAHPSVLARVAHRLPGARHPLGSLRAGRGAARPGGRHAPVAAAPRDHRRADHRAEDGHGRHRGGALPPRAPPACLVPRAVAGEDRAVSDLPTHTLGRPG